MNPLQRAVPLPEAEIGVRRGLRRPVLGQGCPLAAGRQHIEDRVQRLTHVLLGLAPAALRRRDQRLDRAPTPRRSDRSDNATLDGPRRGDARASTSNGILGHDLRYRPESQPVPPTQLLSGSALRDQASGCWQEYRRWRDVALPEETRWRARPLAPTRDRRRRPERCGRWDVRRRALARWH